MIKIFEWQLQFTTNISYMRKNQRYPVKTTKLLDIKPGYPVQTTKLMIRGVLFFLTQRGVNQRKKF